MSSGPLIEPLWRHHIHASVSNEQKLSGKCKQIKYHHPLQAYLMLELVTSSDLHSDSAVRHCCQPVCYQLPNYCKMISRLRAACLHHGLTDLRNNHFTDSHILAWFPTFHQASLRFCLWAKVTLKHASCYFQR